MRLEPENPEAWKEVTEYPVYGQKVYFAEEMSLDSRAKIRYEKAVSETGSEVSITRKRIDRWFAIPLERRLVETVKYHPAQQGSLIKAEYNYSLSERQESGIPKNISLIDRFGSWPLIAALTLPKKDFSNLDIRYTHLGVFDSFVLDCNQVTTDQMEDFTQKPLEDNLRHLIQVFAFRGAKLFRDSESRLLNQILGESESDPNLEESTQEMIVEKYRKGWSSEETLEANADVLATAMKLTEVAEQVEGKALSFEEAFEFACWLSLRVLGKLPANYLTMLQAQRNDVIKTVLEKTIIFLLKSHYFDLEQSGSYSVFCFPDQERVDEFKLSFREGLEKEFHNARVADSKIYSFDNNSYSVGRKRGSISLRVASLRKSDARFEVMFAEKVDLDQFRKLLLSENPQDWQKGLDLFRLDYK
ncbi:hypothetical protein HYU95_02710 [Candidatus Daviesbacteria bacterium]|nr:hypothetical protein [Candidatus Daviesbacteria bacterium]